MMLKNILSLFLFVGILQSSHAQSIRFYDVEDFNDYQLILRKAIDEEKMLFAAVYKTEDGFGDMVRDDVFEGDSLVKVYDSFLSFASNIDREMGQRFLESFNISNTPSFLYFSNEEELVLVKSGKLTADDFIKAASQAKENAQLFSELKSKYSEQKLTSPEWQKLLELYALNFSFSETQELAMEYLNGLNQTQLLTEENAPILVTYGIDLETSYPALIIKNKNTLQKNTDIQGFYQSAFAYNFDLATANNDTVLLEKVFATLLSLNTDTAADLGELKFQSQKLFGIENENYSVLKRTVLEKSESQKTDSAKAEFIFDEAYAIADEFNADKAQRVVKSLAKKANDLKADFRYKMLEAYMAYLLKDFDAASKLLQESKAMTQNPNNLRKAEGLEQMVEKERN